MALFTKKNYKIKSKIKKGQFFCPFLKFQKSFIKKRKCIIQTKNFQICIAIIMVWDEMKRSYSFLKASVITFGDYVHIE